VPFKVALKLQTHCAMLSGVTIVAQVQTHQIQGVVRTILRGLSRRLLKLFQLA